MSIFTRCICSAILLATILASQASATEDSAHVFVAGPANDSAAPIFYARDLGLYKKARLDVTAQAFENLGSTVAAVVGGTMAFAAISLPAIAIARDKGLPIVIVAPLSIYSMATPTTGLVVLKTSAIKRGRDLNGKTIVAQNLSSLAYYATMAWIDKHGGNASSVKWIQLHDNESIAALRAGRADAAAITEPALDDAVHHSNATLLAPVYDVMGDKFLTSAVFTTEDYAKAHPDTVRSFAEAIMSANRWANNNRPQSAKMLANYAGIAIPLTATRVTYAEAIDPANAQPVLDMLSKYNVLNNKLSVKDLFSREVVDLRAEP